MESESQRNLYSEAVDNYNKQGEQLKDELGEIERIG
jgi:uncharacterized protein YdcH (DUF465 family)